MDSYQPECRYIIYVYVDVKLLSYLSLQSFFLNCYLVKTTKTVVQQYGVNRKELKAEELQTDTSKVSFSSVFVGR